MFNGSTALRKAFWGKRLKKIVTYVVLVPHDVEECVEGQVEIGAAEARQRSEDAAGEEHAMQVLLGVREQLLHFLLLLWVHP